MAHLLRHFELTHKDTCPVLLGNVLYEKKCIFANDCKVKKANIYGILMSTELSNLNVTSIRE